MIQNAAAEIKIRAERRAGEILAETVQVGNPQLSQRATIAPTLDDLGINRDQSSRWQKIASIPEDGARKTRTTVTDVNERT